MGQRIRLSEGSPFEGPSVMSVLGNVSGFSTRADIWANDEFLFEVPGSGWPHP